MKFLTLLFTDTNKKENFGIRAIDDDSSTKNQVNELVVENEQNLQNEGYSLLNKANEVEEFLKDKWLQLKKLFKGCKNQKDVSRQALSATNLKELSLQEDIFVGDIIRNYKLAYINFTNVHIFGLPKEVSSEISLNSEATQVRYDSDLCIFCKCIL